MLYGGKQRLDVARLQRLVDAFQGFTTQGLLGSGGPPVAKGQGKAVDPMLREALVAMFSQRGSYVQASGGPWAPHDELGVGVAAVSLLRCLLAV